MLPLQGKLRVLKVHSSESYMVTVTRNPTLPVILRRRSAFLSRGADHVTDFKAVLWKEASGDFLDCDVFQIPDEYDYLDEGDIIQLNSSTGAFRCLYRRNSLDNTILLTERCDHYCLMCSQPPKKHDDSWLLQEAFDLISMMPRETERLGFSGGEPTLYGERFIELLRHTRRSIPDTALDILSNGRAFKSFAFAKRYAEVDHRHMVIGIPLYSDDAAQHEYIVQGRGAFDETLRGIINLKALRQKVEIRVVIHKQSINRLVKTCEFIARNLLFVDHVAMMGLEITGFTRPNLDLLWIDPFEYKDVLSEAVLVLNSYGVPASIYNHQLCTVNRDVWGNYRKSISDWKTEFVDECRSCTKRSECGGLFSSSKLYRQSAYIKAFT